jgi:anaerobic selenocysteine-containing dehydrogenase
MEGVAPDPDDADGIVRGQEAAAVSAAVAAAAADNEADSQIAETEANEAQSAAEAHRVPRPPLVRFQAMPTAAAPAVDAYSLRLVATRKLYDGGTATQQSPSLAGLVVGPAVRLHPHDFDRVGVEAGTEVTVSSSAGRVSLPAHPDPGVPRGSAVVYVNQPGAAVNALIDATALVNDVRVLPS